MTKSRLERYSMIKAIASMERNEIEQACKEFWVAYNLKYSKVVDEIKKKSDRNPFVKCQDCDS